MNETKCSWQCDDDGIVFLRDAAGRSFAYRCRCPRGKKNPEAWYRAWDKEKKFPIAFPMVPVHPSELPPSGRDRAAGKDG